MTDPVPADDGDLDGRYSIGDLVSSAGAVETYSGYDMRLDRAVTIQLLRKDLTDDAERRAEFESAVAATAAATDPNRLIYDAGILQGRPCVVTEADIRATAVPADSTAVIPIEEDTTLEEQITDEPIAPTPLATQIRGRWRSLDASRRRGLVQVVLTLLVVLLLVVAASRDDDPAIPGAPGPPSVDGNGLPPEVPRLEEER